MSLGRLPAHGVVPQLERVLRGDPAWQPRFAAALALGRTRRPFAAPMLAEALATDKAWRVRLQAAQSLQDLGTTHAAEALVPGLFDPEPQVRAAVAAALAAIGGPGERAAVGEALRMEKVPAVRDVLLVASREASTR
jgi:HEAT repeat protein